MSSLKLFLFSLEKLPPSLQKNPQGNSKKNPSEAKEGFENHHKIVDFPMLYFLFLQTLKRHFFCSALKNLSWRREEFWGADCWLWFLSVEMSLTSMTCTLQMKWELEGCIPKLKGQCSVEWQNSGTFYVEELGSGNQNNPTEWDRETKTVPFQNRWWKVGTR